MGTEDPQVWLLPRRIAALERYWNTTEYSDEPMMKDTSSPSKPAPVVSRPALKQHSVFKPTGGLVASFVFLRDAEQLAESLFDYVKYEER